MISKKIFAVTLISGISIFWILNFTSPITAGPMGIFGFFVLVYVFLFGILSFFLYGANKIIHLSFLNSRIGLNLREKDIKFFLKYSAILAFAPLIAIVRISTGGIGIFEIILIIIFEIIACVYISKR